MAVLVPWEGDEGGGEGNWWSMKWDFETGAGRGDLTKEGGMSQEQRQGRGTKRRWPACWGRPTHCYWTTVRRCCNAQCFWSHLE